MNTLIKLALLAAFTQWTAQAAEISLFEHGDFGGREVKLHDNARDLNRIGFNDRVSSAIVRSGTWEICEHADFAGRCLVLERGEYPRLEGFNDAASSVRQVENRGRDRGRDHGHGNDRGNDDHRGYDDRNVDSRRDAIVLFEHRRFEGRPLELHRNARSLVDYGFNDKAGSFVVYEGEWEVCQHANFEGQCRVYGPGRYSDLDYMNNQISSVRRVR
ncbi:beta/gamma crystallin family protein [Oxalobacteraceae bacterium]|nr:beta/gamma crystallin family protein [Oxalobacteraceae bacterium]